MYLSTVDGIFTDINGVVYVNQCTTCNPSAFGTTDFFFKAGYLYMSYNGFSIGFTNTEKIGPLLCPPDYNIPIGQ